jgi:EAL domain-containing protein (putative c-di-GMP-specific phosphodiesterase class I)
VFIGDWVMRQACTALARLHRQLPAHNRPFVSVNIAPQQFLQPDFTQSVRRAIADSGLPPRCLKLEVTEGVAIIDAARTRAVLEEIRAWGVQTSLDDFGTGYSSLSYLKNLPFDSLKIDRSFTASIDDPKSRDIIQTILDLAGKLGLTVVAEGINPRNRTGCCKAWAARSARAFTLPAAGGNGGLCAGGGRSANATGLIADRAIRHCTITA